MTYIIQCRRMSPRTQCHAMRGKAWYQCQAGRACSELLCNMHNTPACCARDTCREAASEAIRCRAALSMEGSLVWKMHL